MRLSAVSRHLKIQSIVDGLSLRSEQVYFPFRMVLWAVTVIICERTKDVDGETLR